LKHPISFETTFGTYVVDELIGEGGAGRVYGGVGIDGRAIALKVLAKDRTTSDKRRRFKNEVAFLQRNRHRNIVAALDYGITHDGEAVCPFYVMRRYHSNLRDLMRGGIGQDQVLPFFSQILDGVEAAHLHDVVHRDLKPENILYDADSKSLAIADFGTARFTEDLVATIVETAPNQRLANFQYAAPEQRIPGGQVRATADIYALGLMLNEMFTGAVPQGTEYRLVGQVAGEQDFLDEVVSVMLRQNPDERPASIADVKGLIQRHKFEAVSLQRLGRIDGTVIKLSEVDEPLAETPPKVVAAAWDRERLTLTLDRPVTPEWVEALHQLGNYTSVLGRGPNSFSFSGNQASANARETEAQPMVDHFKNWLPAASQSLKNRLEQAVHRREESMRAELRREREAEEARLRVTRKLKI
jgi:serine/threonine protein kinase